MNRYKLEVLAEAISRYSGYNDPSSDAYLARNPGGLIAHSPLHLRDDGNKRVFISMMDGWQALLFDIQLKLNGKSRAKLQPTDTLVKLAEAYSQQPTTAQAWAGYLRKALRDQSVTQKTQLDYFFKD